MPRENDDNFDEDELDEENEDVNDSDENNDEDESDESSENEDQTEDDSEDNDEDDDSEDDSDDDDSDDESDEDSDDDSEDDSDDDDDSDRSYRPSTEEKKDAAKANVPLKKYLILKKKYKEAKASGASDIDNETLEEFAEDAGLKIEVVKKLAKIISRSATKAATRKAEEITKPIVAEKLSKENREAFDRDFEKRIAKQFPDLISKKDVFMRIAFSKDFLHLKTLDDIRQEFFPDAKPAQTKQVKTGKVVKGSQGGNKETERIDLAALRKNPDSNPALYERVMKDPKLRDKYNALEELV